MTPGFVPARVRIILNCREQLKAHTEIRLSAIAGINPLKRRSIQGEYGDC